MPETSEPTASARLQPASDPNPSDALPGTCAVRQVHKDPATVTRPAVFGAGGAGFYSAQAQTTYFDYAHTLLELPVRRRQLRLQRCAGFVARVEPTAWVWALLVLQRSTGGACADANNDGKCDEIEAMAMKVRRYCCATRISTATSR